jgi:NMD protein affecting ribosome stability and mRNA decay
MTGEKVEMYCSSCDADYIIIHNLNRPYKIKFCSFCGEELFDEEDMNIEEWEEDEI